MKREEIIEKFNRNESYNNCWQTLDECEIYHQTKEGMNAIFDEWLKAKTTPVWDGKSVLEILSQHPNYVPEKGYVVFSSNYNRPLDIVTVQEILEQMRYWAKEIILEEIIIPPFSFSEIKNIKRRLDSIITFMEDNDYYGEITVNGRGIQYYRREYTRFRGLEERYYERNRGISFCGDIPYTRESVENKNKFCDAIFYISDWCHKHKSDFMLQADEIACDSIENITGLRIHKGTKMNKVIQRICREYGVDKSIYYNSWTGRLGDAISPMQYTRHTIISANPVDYYRASFGDTWTSCMNIDKALKRFSSRNGMYGAGCTASGTESYMLDPSTVIMYTVDADYDGKDFEMQDKKNRCLFHIGESKFIMGRVYPQGTDGAEAVYKEWREKFQNFLATCMGVINYWSTNKDSYLKREQIYSTGTHYQDYNMDYCNIAGWSYLKPTPDTTHNPTTIRIGHYPICPCCGEEHEWSESIECRDCYEQREEEEREFLGYCGRCEEPIYENDDYVYCEDNETYYCNENCANDEGVFFCENDDEWHDDEHCFRDDRNDYYYSNDALAVETVDGHRYYSFENAWDDGYEEDCNGDWYPADEFVEDDETGEYFRPESEDDAIEIDYDSTTYYFRNSENAIRYGFVEDEDGNWTMEG